MLITRILDPSRFTAERLYALTWDQSINNNLELYRLMLSRAVEAGILGTDETPQPYDNTCVRPSCANRETVASTLPGGIGEVVYDEAHRKWFRHTGVARKPALKEYYWMQGVGVVENFVADYGYRMEIMVEVEPPANPSREVASTLPPPPLGCEFDATVWAAEFVKQCERTPGIWLDAEAMTAWFATAIMAGYDHRAHETEHREVVSALPGGRPESQDEVMREAGVFSGYDVHPLEAIIAQLQADLAAREMELRGMVAQRETE